MALREISVKELYRERVGIKQGHRPSFGESDRVEQGERLNRIKKGQGS